VAIANTIKTKVFFYENKYKCHNKVPSDEQFKLMYKINKLGIKDLYPNYS